MIRIWDQRSRILASGQSLNPLPVFMQSHFFETFPVSSSPIGESNGTPLQYSCLENPMDGGAWKAAVRGVAEGRTQLSDFTFTFHFHALEREMATHSSVLAWRIPRTGEPFGLLSMRSHRVRHNWSDLAAAFYSAYSRMVFARGWGVEMGSCH